ncbi:MAG: DUF1552 domain-containing protein, partial [Candidatus Obscuribacterales bacterium]|nr:DUF1552 domain-containing protein [Steroidobacteraceae bacterium]
NWELTPELVSLRGLENKVSVFSGFRVLLDGCPNIPHWTGQGAVLTGVAPTSDVAFDGASFDTVIAAQLAHSSRFRSIHLSPSGDSELSYSTSNGARFNAPDATPLALYTRLFADHSPTSHLSVLLKTSVLSAVQDQRAALMQQAGVDDRHRLDEYFTGVRQIEAQLAVEHPPTADDQIDRVNTNNKLMAELMAMALVCNQTNVFNVVHAGPVSATCLPNDTSGYHAHTHNESVDAHLGYQVTASKLAELSFRGYSDFLRALHDIKEGDSTLLDHTLVFGFSDTGYAKIHSIDNIPMFLAGGANGKHRSGQHVLGNGDPVSRISLTAQQLMGMPISEFGVGSMKTARPCSEVAA